MTTHEKALEPVEREEWLIRKGGYFYRQNCAGYTTSKFEAGRYTKSEAEMEAAVEPWHMKAIHQDDVEDDPASSRVRMDAARIAELEAEVERLTKERDDALMVKCEAVAGWRDAEALSRTGAVKELEAELGWYSRTEHGALDGIPYKHVAHVIRVMLSRLSALEPAAPEGCAQYAPPSDGQQEAARIGDAVLAWMTKYDLLDGEQEYYVADVIAVLDDLTPLTRPSEQAVAWQNVETPIRDALRNLIDIIEAQGRDRTPAPKRETRDEANSRDERDQVFARAISEAEAALKAAMEAGRHE